MLPQEAFCLPTQTGLSCIQILVGLSAFGDEETAQRGAERPSITAAGDSPAHLTPSEGSSVLALSDDMRALRVSNQEVAAPQWPLGVER